MEISLQNKDTIDFCERKIQKYDQVSGKVLDLVINVLDLYDESQLADKLANTFCKIEGRVWEDTLLIKKLKGTI